MNTYFKEEREIEINGIKIPVEVAIYVEEDDIVPEDTYTDARDIARIKSGKSFLAHIMVEAMALGEVGKDGLGACELPPNSFYDSKPFDTAIKSYLKEHDMVDNALNELKRMIIETADKLKPYATK